MVYNGMNSTIGYYRGKHDMSNSVVRDKADGYQLRNLRLCSRRMGGTSHHNLLFQSKKLTAYQITRKVFFEPDLKSVD